MPQVPAVGRVVHYVARGSLDGVFPPVCRAADIAEAGAWLTEQTSQGPDEGTRVLEQRWDPEACALVVKNPTGLFFSDACVHDETRIPGTWHWPERV